MTCHDMVNPIAVEGCTAKSQCLTVCTVATGMPYRSLSFTSPYVNYSQTKPK